MKVKFTLQEMFVVYALMKNAKLMSHKIALKKLVNDFLGDDKFGVLIEIKDLTEANVAKAQESNSGALQALRKKVMASGSKPSKKLLEDKVTLAKKIADEANKKNEAHTARFVSIIEASKKEDDREFDTGDLVKKAILTIAMDESVKVEDLNMSQDAIDSLADICLKLGID